MLPTSKLVNGSDIRAGAAAQHTEMQMQLTAVTQD